ncbi:MAG: hypothetical protein KDH16_07675 [Rhodocyclaceae bacterium]|nr:hypothetical protein [Rhodocyclaceae bacterium]
MTINEAVYLIAALTVALVLSHGRASYWKGKAEERGNMDGWETEAMYWRRHHDKAAAEWVEENV